jgi:hypothetical protein
MADLANYGEKSRVYPAFNNELRWACSAWIGAP